MPACVLRISPAIYCIQTPSMRNWANGLIFLMLKALFWSTKSPKLMLYLFIQFLLN